MDKETRLFLKGFLDRIEDKLDRVEENVRELSRGQRTLSVNQRVLQEQAKVNAEESLAKITAQGTVMTGLKTTVDVLKGTSATIAEEMKRIADANPAVDFGPITEALAANDTILAGTVAAVQTNTPEESGSVSRSR